MKRAAALLVAGIMIFGASTTVMAQTVTNGIKYNILVDGDEKTFSDEEAIVVDGFSMFTEECYTQNFGCESLVAENVTKASAFDYEGKKYYSLREVAENCGLNVFWDSATSTVLVVDEETYEKVKSLIEASNTNNADVKKVELEMNGTVGLSVDLGGDKMKAALPLNAAVKINLDSPFMEMVMKIKSNELAVDTEMKIYDDGKNMYMNDGDEWYKSESSLSMSKELIAQMSEMNPAKNALAQDLSFAGLKLTESENNFVLEGDMYVSETFKGIEIDTMMQEMYSQMGVEDMGISFKYDWPSTMYVKYVMDKDGSIIEMSFKFGFGLELGMDGEAETLKLLVDADFNIPKYVIDGDFEEVIPQEILDEAIDLSEMAE